MDKNFILTGPPRSGTTLACYLLNKVPDTIALHEPMNLEMFPDPKGGLEAIRSFFPRMRQSLLQEGKALSKVADDKIPDNPFQNADGGSRQSIVTKKWVHFDKPLSPHFNLVMKHNAHFTFLLPQLIKEYPCAAILRNPVSVIASWNSIQAPVAQGLINVLKTLDPTLYKELETIPDVLTRQIRLLDAMFSCYLDLGPLTIIRYEDLIISEGRDLSHIIPGASILHEPLASRNRSSLYNQEHVATIKQKVLDYTGPWLKYYSQAEIEAV